MVIITIAVPGATYCSTAFVAPRAARAARLLDGRKGPSHRAKGCARRAFGPSPRRLSGHVL